jgi:nucleotide-binding universal stress UspA family protein
MAELKNAFDLSEPALPSVDESQRRDVDSDLDRPCILVGHDFTPASREAMWQGAVEAAERGGSLLLVHVSYIPPMGPGLWLDHGANVFLHDGMLEHVKARLDELAEDVRAMFPELPVDTVVLDGVPAKTLLQVAREVGADRIVVGTHGRSGLSHFLLGSVAGELIRTAPVPVLVVPGPEEPAK